MKFESVITRAQCVWAQLSQQYSPGMWGTVMFSLCSQLWLYFYARQYFHTLKLSSVFFFLPSTGLIHRLDASSLDVSCFLVPPTFLLLKALHWHCSNQSSHSAGTPLVDPDVLLLHLGHHHGGRSLFVLWVSHLPFVFLILHCLPSCFTSSVALRFLSFPYCSVCCIICRQSLPPCLSLSPILLFPILAPGSVVAPLQHTYPPKLLSGFGFPPSNFVRMVIQHFVRFVVKLTIYI